MLGVHEKNLPQFVYTDQINYTNHVRLFILSVFCISLRLCFIWIFLFF
jgi:hypothetical protein